MLQTDTIEIDLAQRLGEDQCRDIHERRTCRISGRGIAVVPAEPGGVLRLSDTSWCRR